MTTGRHLLRRVDMQHNKLGSISMGMNRLGRCFPLLFALSLFYVESYENAAAQYFAAATTV